MKCEKCENGHLIGIDQQHRLGCPMNTKNVILICKECGNEWPHRIYLRAPLMPNTEIESIEWKASKYNV